MYLMHSPMNILTCTSLSKGVLLQSSRRNNLLTAQARERCCCRCTQCNRQGSRLITCNNKRTLRLASFKVTLCCVCPPNSMSHSSAPSHAMTSCAWYIWRNGPVSVLYTCAAYIILDVTTPRDCVHAFYSSHVPISTGPIAMVLGWCQSCFILPV